MISKIFISGFIVILLCVPVLAADGNTGGQNINTLPWEMIVEKFNAKEPFCTAKSNDEKTNNFALDSNALTITLPSIKISQEQTEAELNLFVWQQDQWMNLSPVTTEIDSNGLTVDDNAIAEGFYNLSLIFDKNDVGKENNLYAVVATDWKKDILAFCREMKYEIESNADAKLIRSSIAVSHFDHTMEIVSQASFLSGKILEALADAVQNKKTFDFGKCPDLVVGGLNKIRLKRFSGAQITEFVVFVPENYDSSQKWPLLLTPDPRRRDVANNYSWRSGYIDVWWHFPFPMEFEWKDYQYLFNILKNKLNLDSDRIYLYGLCGNGIAAMALALNYPDEWAECRVSVGNSYRHLAGNVLNLPLTYSNVTYNKVPDIAAYYDFAVKCFQYYGCRFFKWSKTQGITYGVPSPKAVKERYPQRVLYTIESLRNPKAYWVKIDGRKDENLTGMIDASVDEQKVIVNTRNVDAYSLDLTQAPVDSNKPVEIVENGQSIGFVTEQIFSRKSGKYKDAVYIKNEHLHGPVWDAFTDPYVVVYGTGGEDGEFSGISGKVANSLANGGPCFSDTNMPDELVKSHNLILVGTAKSNLWLSKVCKELPVKIREGKIWAEGKNYDKHNMGFILIYPNPINPEKYVVVFSGTSKKAIKNITGAYSQMKSIQPADVGIFEVDEQGNIKWHIIEKFNTTWTWHGQWKQVLTTASKKHPKWRWCQWVAKALRTQLEADITICEEPFKFSHSAPIGQITYRDLFNSFRNDWIVKVKLDGYSLRKLLTTSFSSISERKVDTLIINGVTFAKLEQNSKETILCINELEKDKEYTMACPHKCINGQRLGVALQDYEIVGEGYLVPMLKDYLCENRGSDIDSQLDSLKLNML